MKSHIFITSLAALLAPLVTRVHALMIDPTMSLAQEGGSIGVGNFGTAGIAFAKDVIFGGALAPTHTIANVNNGTFGNSSSWIGDSLNSFVGIGFGGPLTIASFAFGRDNTGTFGDRAVGLYTIQFTADPNPAVNFLTDTWTTIGTINLDIGAGVGNPALRHRFNIGTPVTATGFRLIAPGAGAAGGAAIDELELFATPGVVTITPPLKITSSPGFSVGWNGNDGNNFSASGATVPNNLALATNGGIGISSGDLGPQIGVPFHRAVNLNDGLYGNGNSWIGGDGAPSPFYAGVMLPGLFDVTSIAWGRDNGLDAAGGECCGGQLSDRSQGTYTIQRTLDGSIWETVGTLDYNYSDDSVTGGGFTSYFRHEFDLSDGNGGILAMGLRLLVPATGIGAGTAIDEIELFGSPVPEPGSVALLAGGMLSLVSIRRRRV